MKQTVTCWNPRHFFIGGQFNSLNPSSRPLPNGSITCLSPAPSQLSKHFLFSSSSQQCPTPLSAEGLAFISSVKNEAINPLGLFTHLLFLPPLGLTLILLQDLTSRTSPLTHLSSSDRTKGGGTKTLSVFPSISFWKQIAVQLGQNNCIRTWTPPGNSGDLGSVYSIVLIHPGQRKELRFSHLC